MKIKKMTAGFGKLKNESLELKDGLNIICAPNESGKSTWCAFINAMLYGIDSSAREKGGIKPDKTKYAPWSGEPMSGTMDVEYEGKELTITRSGRANAPMREISVTYSGTSQTFEGIDPDIGKTLLGVSKEVFERSAFIGQGNVVVGSSPELEKRISAIVQTGDENASYTESDERLRVEMRKRRYNKSGRLPEIESEIESKRKKLEEIREEESRGGSLKAAMSNALERRDSLNEKVAESRKESRRNALERLTNARNNISKLEDELQALSRKTLEAEKALYSSSFGDTPFVECAAKVSEDTGRIVELGGVADGASAKGNKVLFAVLTIVALLFFALGAFGKIFDLNALWFIRYIAYGTGTVFLLLSFIQAIRNKRLKEIYKNTKMEIDDILNGYKCNSKEEIAAVLEAHEKLCFKRDVAVSEQNKAAYELETEKEKKAVLDAELLKELNFNEDGEAAKLTTQLRDAENELRRIREEAASWEGRKTALGDSFQLEQSISELKEERERLSFEYEALSLAADTLKAAAAEIQSRLTPMLSRRTAEIFSQLTGGRYDTVALDRELSAVARLSEESVPRETAYLSIGAVDQLYLAVRLAICELALPEDKSCPIILDDALGSFDDERCKEALRLLNEMAKTRQIILFSCHGREAQFMELLERT